MQHIPLNHQVVPVRLEEHSVSSLQMLVMIYCESQNIRVPVRLLVLPVHIYEIHVAATSVDPYF